jgi:hypothetical protein
MSRSAKKKPGSKGRTASRKKPKPAKEQARDSDDIERAVYDGMQDLRAAKPR